MGKRTKIAVVLSIATSAAHGAGWQNLYYPDGTNVSLADAKKLLVGRTWMGQKEGQTYTSKVKDVFQDGDSLWIEIPADGRQVGMVGTITVNNKKIVTRAGIHPRNATYDGRISTASYEGTVYTVRYSLHNNATPDDYSPAAPWFYHITADVPKGEQDAQDETGLVARCAGQPQVGTVNLAAPVIGTENHANNTGYRSRVDDYAHYLVPDAYGRIFNICQWDTHAEDGGRKKNVKWRFEAGGHFMRIVTQNNRNFYAYFQPIFDKGQAPLSTNWIASSN